MQLRDVAARQDGVRIFRIGATMGKVLGTGPHKDTCRVEVEDAVRRTPTRQIWLASMWVEAPPPETRTTYE